MAKKSISISIDENLKKEAEEVFSKYGLSIEEALNVFIKQSIKEKGIPFRITMNKKTKE